ncbi:MAG: endonuclease III [bacterium]|nr:endonuclease III [bacterium]
MKTPRPSKRTVGTILRKLHKLYPGAECALQHGDPFQLLIATILSAQCTDKRVNMITPELFKQAPNPEKMLALGPKRLERLIQTCGLYQSKAKNIRGACQAILQRHGGEVPNSLKELIQLPGVGRKTANVVLANAFGVPAFAVDTHVFRVSQRLGLARGKTPDQIELQLMDVIPKKDWIDGHHLLIHHGRHLCRARNPLCGSCPLQKQCRYFSPATLGEFSRK